MPLAVPSQDTLQGSIVLGRHKVDLDVAIDKPLHRDPSRLYAELIPDLLRYDDLAFRSNYVHLYNFLG